MIERFRDWNPRGKLRIKYVDSNGMQGIWETDQQVLLSKIVEVVRSYKAQGQKLTNRQLYYQLVTENIIPNAEATYKRICTFITDARYGGRIDWDDIVDRARNPSKHSEWDSVKDLIKSAVAAYRLPRWSDQDNYVELYCEKQALEGVFQPVADQFHIYFGANKGYCGASTVYDIAKRIKEQIEAGKKCIILYFGDHDSSGLDMIRDIRDRITEFLTKGEDETYYKINSDDEVVVDEDNIEDYFEIIPLALNMAQIKQFNPPPNPAKMSDPRAAWYIKTYGKQSWELDALKPNVLIDLATQGIMRYLNADKYNRWVQLEKTQKQKLKDFGESLAEDEHPEDEGGDSDE